MIKTLYKRILGFLFPDSDLEKIEKLTLEDVLDRYASPLKKMGGIESFLSYKDPLVRKLIHSLKYKRSEKSAELCADVFLNFMSEELGEKIKLNGGEKIILIPIPMSRRRLRDRGYNHTLLLSEKIIERGGEDFFRLEKNCLLRKIETPPQTSIKNKGERIRNVKGVFEIKNESLVKNKVVVVLDDVSTTGSTLREAKKVLLKSEAEEVLCVSIAH